MLVAGGHLTIGIILNASMMRKTSPHSEAVLKSDSLSGALTIFLKVCVHLKRLWNLFL